MCLGLFGQVGKHAKACSDADPKFYYDHLFLFAPIFLSCNYLKPNIINNKGSSIFQNKHECHLIRYKLKRPMHR